LAKNYGGIQISFNNSSTVREFAFLPILKDGTNFF